MKFPIFVFLLLCGCTSPQLIRATDYYALESGILDDSAKKSQYLRHHPMHADDVLFKEGEPRYDQTKHYFIWGLLPSDPAINVAAVCGTQPFRQADANHSIPQALVSLLTIGVYTPRTVRIWCGPIPK